MFNDERERQMLEQDPYTQSIQAWATSVRRGGKRSLAARLLQRIGTALISLGSRLTERFGGKADHPSIDPKDRVFN